MQLFLDFQSFLDCFGPFSTFSNFSDVFRCITVDFHTFRDFLPLSIQLRLDVGAVCPVPAFSNQQAVGVRKLIANYKKQHGLGWRTGPAELQLAALLPPPLRPLPPLPPLAHLPPLPPPATEVLYMQNVVERMHTPICHAFSSQKR